MKTSSVVLTAALVIAGVLAITFRSELLRERERADALAERAAVLEPVERPSPTTSRENNTTAHEAFPAQADAVAEPPHAVVDSPEPAPLKPAIAGSPHALRQLERLQSALVDGTPLRDYQARALVVAIDRLQANGKNDAESRGRLKQAAADILFESQFEKFAELLERDAD